MVKIAQASIDEHGRISGGAAGDQTGRETNIKNYYTNSWTLCIWPEDKSIREAAAENIQKLVNSNLVGYDQSQRNTLYQKLKKYNFNVDKYIASKEKSETDCSALVYAAFACADPSIRSDENAPATSQMRTRYKEFGYNVSTDSKYRTSDKYLIRGMALVREGHHTVMVISDSEKIDIVFPSRGYYTLGDGNTINLNYNIYIKKIQQLIGAKVDGHYGPKTVLAVKQWQKKNNLTEDGQFGKLSAKKAGWNY